MVRTAVSIDKKLREVDRKFKVSFAQLRVLDRQMDILQRRFTKAKENKTKAAFNSFRLQLSTLEGVRQAYYLYACDRAAERHRLQKEMRLELTKTTGQLA